MTQTKLSKETFHIEGLYTSGHARRCEAMVRNSAGGLESVHANEFKDTLEILFDPKRVSVHTLKDIIDETGYIIIND